MEGVLAIVFIFGGGSLFLLAISPIGRAIAARIQGSTDGIPSDTAERIEAASQELLHEVEALRHEVVEIQERLDFAERLIARQQRELPSPEGAADEP